MTKRRKLKLEVSESAVCGKCDRAFAVLGVVGQRRELKFCPWCGHPTGLALDMKPIPATWVLTRKLEPMIKAKKEQDARDFVDVAAEAFKGAKPPKAGWCECPPAASASSFDGGKTFVCGECGRQRNMEGEDE